MDPRQIDADWNYDGMVEGLRGKEFRRLIERHIQATSTRHLRLATEATALCFSPQQTTVLDFLLERWEAHANTGPFWREDASDVFVSVIDDVRRAFDGLGLPLTERLALWYFQAFTMRLALAASESREVRRFAGIKASWWDIL